MKEKKEEVEEEVEDEENDESSPSTILYALIECVNILIRIMY